MKDNTLPFVIVENGWSGDREAFTTDKDAEEWIASQLEDYGESCSISVYRAREINYIEDTTIKVELEA